MKTLGLLGGMTYHSTMLYYGQINAHIQRVRGGSNAASLILHSFDFGEMSALFAAGRWDTVTSEFVTAAKHMRDAGAEGIAIGCNIGHKVAGDVEARVGLPVLHIADFTAQALRERKLTKVALLGTRAAMEDDFISARLVQQVGVQVLVPEKPDRDVIDAAIFNELSTGTVTEETRKFMVGVAEKLVQKGAQGVVLACTDLQFVLKPDTVGVALFDTLDLHTKGLAQWALKE